MNSMIFIAFIGLITGSLILLETSPIEMIHEISKLFDRKEQTLKSKIKQATSTKKKKGLKLLIDETKEILKATNKEDYFTKLCIISFVLLVAGAFIAVLMNNGFLIPVLAIGF